MTEEYTTKLKDEAKTIYAVLATGIVWGKEGTVILNIDDTARFEPYRWVPFTAETDFNNLYHPIGVGGTVPKEYLERFLNFSDLGRKIELTMAIREVRFETVRIVKCIRSTVVVQNVIYDDNISPY